MTIERLLAYLGYDMNAPIVGRAEAVDTSAMQRLTAPRRPSEAQAKPAAEATKAEPKADEATERRNEGRRQPKAKPKSKAARAKRSGQGRRRRPTTPSPSRRRAEAQHLSRDVAAWIVDRSGFAAADPDRHGASVACGRARLSAARSA